ncbi:MAG: DUF5681 domain-containing protein [Aestuariivirga sp.]
MVKYNVGYGKPPGHTKFNPGQSGNPRGRPKGRLSTARLLEKHLDSKVTFNIGNKKKKMARREALILSIIGDAFKDNQKAKKHLLDLSLSLDVHLHAGKASAADPAQDKAVLDALLYSYGMKMGGLPANDPTAENEKPKSPAQTPKDGPK